jgi:hypothetical protein
MARLALLAANENELEVWPVMGPLLVYLPSVGLKRGRF